MTGLELSNRYWQEVVRPAMEDACPQVLEHAAVGLVGEGSECFGFDDEISRDHDWGPGVCIWLTGEDFSRWGEAASEVYSSLPQTFCGFRRLHQQPMTAGRVGVLEIGSFYQRFIGMDHAPETLGEWFSLPEDGLATAVNGQVFCDSEGSFTAFRQALLEYYPESLRRKRLAACCALAAQAGQYNYGRCLQRGDAVAAAFALWQFADHIQSIVFLLNRVYRPYYKWAHRAMGQLPLLGRELSAPMEALLSGSGDRREAVEAISQAVIAALRDLDLSRSRSDFLLHHGEEIQQSIEDPRLRNLHLMAK